MQETPHQTLRLDTRADSNKGRDKILALLPATGRRQTGQHMANVSPGKGPLSSTPTKHNCGDYPTPTPNKKTQLKNLGDPNQREKWLEGLAMAQAAETGGDATKHLRHLLQTEEQ